MKRNLRLLGIIFFALFIGTVSASAQKNKDVDEALDDKSKVSGLYVGSYVGFGYSNGWRLEFTPGVGYKLTDWLIAGAGLTYSYGSRFDYQVRNDKLSTTLIGPRVFAKANFYREFYGIAEYQYHTFSVKYRDASGNVNNNAVQYCQDCDPSNPNCNNNCVNKNESALFLGAGYANQFGEGFGMYTDVIIDVLYGQNRLNSPRSTPYTIRIGVFYVF